MTHVTYAEDMVALVRDSLAEILSLRDQKIKKEDDSYVSQGDLRVQSIVFEYVREHLPHHELISEELAPFGDRTWDPEGSYVVLEIGRAHV